MKYTMRLLLSCALILALQPLRTQVEFWTEDFGTGCNQGFGVASYTGPNGAWSSVNTGTNAGSASVWFVSATENGNEPGECGTGCGSDRTLHLGAVSVLGFPADPGAAYYEGLAGFCGILPCGATDKRVQSPVINCSAYSDITLEFDYIEGGNTIDNATLWYYSGTTWTQIADMAKTFSGACSPQGVWTHYAIALPSSANNNANVRIGFRWINNEDGNATDPSFAVDDVVLSVASAGDTEPPVITGCPEDENVSGCEYVIPDYVALIGVSDNLDLSPDVQQDPAAGTLITASTVVVITATDDAGNSSTCQFAISLLDEEPPILVCPEPWVTVETDPGNCYFTLPDYSLLFDYSDNCDPAPVFTQEPPEGSAIMAGDTVTVGLLVTDFTGNAISCSFPLVVEDVSIPVIDCMPAVSDTLPSALDTEMWINVPLAVASDNCQFVVSNSVNGGGVDVSGYYSAGIWPITFTVTDEFGNESTCTTTVEVVGLPCCDWDFDCNYVINVSDLLAFMVYFGTFGGPADFTNDGAVNISDLLLFMSNYGTFCP
ncbi:MAG: hypothetical protein JNM00_00970 [Flavobacteriales bacterium]|nr:hypothetical protein [Flavobacteriales bacterium]